MCIHEHAAAFTSMSKSLSRRRDDGTTSDFRLNVESGEFSESEIIVLLGENGYFECISIILLVFLRSCFHWRF